MFAQHAPKRRLSRRQPGRTVPAHSDNFETRPGASIQRPESAGRTEAEGEEDSQGVQGPNGGYREMAGMESLSWSRDANS